MAQTFTVKTVIALSLRAEGDAPQTYCAGVSPLMACVCFLVVTIDKI